MKYLYPIVLEQQEDASYLATAPDLPGVVVGGATLIAATQAAQDACAMWLCDAENERESIPKASEVATLSVAGNQNVVLVIADTDAYRTMNDTTPIRKTVSIPSWMARKADMKGLSLSKVLQDGLRERLM